MSADDEEHFQDDDEEDDDEDDMGGDAYEAMRLQGGGEASIESSSPNRRLTL